MAFLIVLTVVAVAVAVGALQNGHPVTVSFLFWQFQAPLALVILGAAVAGLAIGGMIGFARALRRWTHREAGPTAKLPEGLAADHPVSKARDGAA
jgi:uncharacterized integral membrane protein